MTHSTHETCCPQGVTIQVRYCERTSTWRISGQWCPDQLMFFDDSIHDMELVAKVPQDIRSQVVTTLVHYLPLLRLAPGRGHAVTE